jgi:hypothetical protein
MLLPVREHVDNFLRRRPWLAHQEGADNQCRIATDDLADALRAQGIGAQPVWVRGHRAVPDNPAARALSADRHRIVLLPDGSLVDITRRQFDPDAQHPSYYSSEAELAAHWREIDRGPAEGAAADEDWHHIEP